jgi:hypothetical protein
VKQTNRSAHVLHRLHPPEELANSQLYHNLERSKEGETQTTDSSLPNRRPRPHCDYGSETKLDVSELSIDVCQNIHKRAMNLDRRLFKKKTARYKSSEMSPIFDNLNKVSKLNQKTFQERSTANCGAIDFTIVDQEGKVSDDNPVVPSLITPGGYRQQPGKSVKEVSQWDSQDPDTIGDHAKKNDWFGMTLFQWRAVKGGEKPALNPGEGKQSRPASKATWASRLTKKFSKRMW